MRILVSNMRRHLWTAAFKYTLINYVYMYRHQKNSHEYLERDYKFVNPISIIPISNIPKFINYISSPSFSEFTYIITTRTPDGVL